MSLLKIIGEKLTPSQRSSLETRLPNFPHFMFYIFLPVCHFVEGNVCRKIRSLFCLVDICVFCFVFLNANSHVCFQFFCTHSDNQGSPFFMTLSGGLTPVLQFKRVYSPFSENSKGYQFLQLLWGQACLVFIVEGDDISNFSCRNHHFK